MRVEEAAERIRRALRAGEVILIVGSMEVFYEGRASSMLGPGERLLIIKEDGSVLVHRSKGYEPVNWQPPDSKIEVAADEGRLVVEARRVRSREVLRIVFTDVVAVFSFKLHDEAEFVMYATEEDMKRAILMEPTLIEEGFKPIESERRTGGSGFVDVFGVDREGNLVVVEVKRRNAASKDIRQLLKYVESVEREFGRRPRAIIAAPGVQRSAMRELTLHGVEFRCVTPRRCAEILRRGRGLEHFL